MADVAKYIRIFTSNPDDAYVSKRITAVSAIETVIKKKIIVADILEFANELISALEMPSESNTIINNVAVNALKKNSTSFVADEEQLQLLTCTLLATLQYLEKAKGFKQNTSPEFVLAIALWSGLSFQKPLAEMERLELLRSELLAITEQMVEEVSIISRDRIPIKIRQAPILPTEKTTDAIVKSIETSYGTTIDSLRKNAILDGEELDILWWILGGWSNLCKVQITSLNPVQKVFVNCFEIGKLLKRFPAKAHAFLVCKGVEHNDEFIGTEILEQLGDKEEILVNEINSTDVIKKYDKIFIVCNFLTNKIEVSGMEQKRTLSEWASRALLEISLMNINNFGE
jgi:hypothetical protein